MAYDRDLENWKGITYQCLRCGHRFNGSKIAMRGRIACPKCSYRVIRKTHPNIVKCVKAI